MPEMAKPITPSVVVWIPRAADAVWFSRTATRPRPSGSRTIARMVTHVRPSINTVDPRKTRSFPRSNGPISGRLTARPAPPLENADVGNTKACNTTPNASVRTAR